MNEIYFPSRYVHCENRKLVWEEKFKAKFNNKNPDGIFQSIVHKPIQIITGKYWRISTKWKMSFFMDGETGSGKCFKLEAQQGNNGDPVKVFVEVMFYASEAIIGREERNFVTIPGETNYFSMPYKYNEDYLTKVICNVTMLQTDHTSRYRLMRKMVDILSNHTLDITLIAVDGKKFFVHSLILAARSRYFKEILEKNEVLSFNCAFKADVLKEIVRYLYTGQVENLEKLAVDISEAAELYNIDELKDICEASLRGVNPAVTLYFVAKLGFKQSDKKVTINARDSSRFVAHSSVVSAKSEFLKEKFETCDFYDEFEFDGEIIKGILRYIYTGIAELKIFGLDITLSIFEVAKKYKLDDLMTKCEDSLQGQLKISTKYAMKVEEFAAKHGLENLKRAAHEFLSTTDG